MIFEHKCENYAARKAEIDILKRDVEAFRKSKFAIVEKLFVTADLELLTLYRIIKSKSFKEKRYVWLLDGLKDTLKAISQA